MKTKKILAAVLSAALCTANAGMTAFSYQEPRVIADEDSGEPAEDTAEEVYDKPQGGDGYYVFHISYHNESELYAEYGDDNLITYEISGYMQKGETRESVENNALEYMLSDYALMGIDPDKYGFDVYTYFYDDYDLTFEEFLDFVEEDILRRDSERDNPTAEVPNPVTGTGLPCAAAALAVLSGAGIIAVNKKRS